jgi:large subunit ribosomal protein L25
MSELVILETEKRDGRGSRKAAKLRKSGKVPAVLYGHKLATVSLSVSKEQLAAVLRMAAPVIDIKTDGGVEKAQIMDLQWDHLGKEVLHIDLKRVSADERIQTDVPLEIKGHAPGVTDGGLLDQPLHSLRVECPAFSVPKSLRVSIAELQLGAAIHVKDVKLPEGVTVLDDPDAVVIHVTKPQAEPEPAAEAAAAGAAEPEVITARKKEEEGEGD